jgi:hypothetical protein
MKELEKKFPHMSINGWGETVISVNPYTGKPEKHLQRTYPIVTPWGKKVKEERERERQRAAEHFGRHR